MANLKQALQDLFRFLTFRATAEDYQNFRIHLHHRNILYVAGRNCEKLGFSGSPSVCNTRASFSCLHFHSQPDSFGSWFYFPAAILRGSFEFSRLSP